MTFPLYWRKQKQVGIDLSSVNPIDMVSQPANPTGTASKALECAIPLVATSAAAVVVEIARAALRFDGGIGSQWWMPVSIETSHIDASKMFHIETP